MLCGDKKSFLDFFVEHIFNESDHSHDNSNGNEDLPFQQFGTPSVITDDDDLLLGMYATADVNLEQYESNAFPENAIVQLEGKSHVLLQTANTSESYQYLPESIDVGLIKDGFAELKNETELIEKNILVKGGYYLVN